MRLDEQFSWYERVGPGSLIGTSLCWLFFGRWSPITRIGFRWSASCQCGVIPQHTFDYHFRQQRQMSALLDWFVLRELVSGSAPVGVIPRLVPLSSRCSNLSVQMMTTCRWDWDEIGVGKPCFLPCVVHKTRQWNDLCIILMLMDKIYYYSRSHLSAFQM